MDASQRSQPESATDFKEEFPVAVPATMKFPYSGIFSPGGFLSTLTNSHKDDHLQCTSTTTIVSSETKDLQMVEEFEEEKENIIPSNPIPDEGQISGMYNDVESTPKNLSTLQLDSEETGNRLLQVDKAFAIDHILEQILSASTTSDLFNLRFVSQRWNACACQILQSRITLNFYDYNLHLEKNRSGSLHCNEMQLSLRLLTTLLQNSTRFPCSKFSFVQNCTMWKYQPFPGNLSDTLLESFLSTYGLNIQELSLNFADTFDAYLPREGVVMSQIMNLILFQAPNLRYLSLRLPAKLEWKANGGSGHPPRGPYSALRTSDPEFHEICTMRKSIQRFNTKLKVIKLWGDVSSKILETVIQLSPNLEEIVVDERFYYYLLEPVNRLHFLRQIELNFDPSKLDIDALDRFASACEERSNDPNLGLSFRELSLRLRDGAQSFSEPQQIRLINVINRILGCSYNSLEVIDFNGVTFLKRLIWPREMPRLGRLELGNPKPDDIVHGESLFPPGFSLSETCPKLQSIRFYDCKGLVSFVDFIKCFDFKPVLSVKSFHVINWNGRTISTDDLKPVLSLFPAAQFAHEWI